MPRCCNKDVYSAYCPNCGKQLSPGCSTALLGFLKTHEKQAKTRLDHWDSKYGEDSPPPTERVRRNIEIIRRTYHKWFGWREWVQQQIKLENHTE